MKFIATSNNVTPSKRLTDKPIPLQDIIESNSTFQKAFKGDTQSFPYGEHTSDSTSNKGSIIQSSSSDNTENLGQTFTSAPRGLVSAIVDAYNYHNHLILRPDDVWQAILTQFSFYVNANAEALRDEFVDFKGQKALVVKAFGTLFTYDFGSFAKRMVDEQISKNLKDASVTEWLLPNFSTTRDEDRIASAVTIMSTLQSYFTYESMLCCGIPSVTLEGTVEDWHLLRKKIDRLPQYDISTSDASGKNESSASPQNVMTEWHGMLSKVLDEFVKSKEGKPDIGFWDSVCDEEHGSGFDYLSGWVTVFTCFTTKGEWQGQRWYDYDGRRASWPKIDMDCLPSGAISVPVTVDDNGKKYKSQMIAGQMAYHIIGDNKDTIQPRTDWCIALTEKDDPRKKRKHIPTKHAELAQMTGLSAQVVPLNGEKEEDDDSKESEVKKKKS